MSFFNSRTPRERLLILLCLGVLLIAALLLLNPESGSGKKLLKAEEASRQNRKLLAETRQWEDENKEWSESLKRSTYDGKPDEVVPQLVVAIQKLAKAEGIHIREIKPLRAKRTAQVTHVPVGVRFTTEFSKTIPFLYRLEDPKSNLVVDRLNIASPDAVSRQVDVEMEIGAYTSWLEPSTGAKTPVAAKG